VHNHRRIAKIFAAWVRLKVWCHFEVWRLKGWGGVCGGVKPVVHIGDSLPSCYSNKDILEQHLAAAAATATAMRRLRR